MAGKVEPGRRSDQLVCLNDLLATCAEISAENCPTTPARTASASSRPCRAGDRGPLREAVVHHSINGSFAIRQGDWKLALCPDSGGWSARGRARDDAHGLPPVQLYDLAADPGEQQTSRTGTPRWSSG